LFALHEHGIAQESFTADQSIQIFLMAVIGGLGSIAGSLTGAIYFGALNQVTTSLLARLLASSGGVLLVLFFFPGGLGAAVFKVRDAFLRRVAIRRRIYVPALMGGIGAAYQLAKIVLAPKLDGDGQPVQIPSKYKLDSRIRTAGTSQQGKRWSAWRGSLRQVSVWNVPSQRFTPTVRQPGRLGRADRPGAAACAGGCTTSGPRSLPAGCPRCR